MKAQNRNIGTLVLVCLLVLIGVITITIFLLIDISKLQHNYQDLSKKFHSITYFSYTTLYLLIISVVLFVFIYTKRRKQIKEYTEVLKVVHNIVNQSNDAIITTDFNLNIVSWNKGAESLYGYAKENVLGKKLLEVVSTKATKEERKEIWQQLKFTGLWKDVLTQYNKEKKVIQVLISISAIKNKHNKITGFAGVCTDITKQLTAEGRLKQMALVAELSNDAIITFNQHLEIINWNKGAERLYGYTAQESINKIITELLAKQPNTKFLELILQNITTEGYWKTEDIHYKKDGTELNVFVSFTPNIDWNGQHTYMAIITDITEQKEIEKKLVDFNKKLEEQVQHKTAQMREIFDRVDWGFVAFNTNDEYIFVNPKACELLNKNEKELLGRNTWKLFPNYEKGFYDAYNQAIETQQTVYHENFSTTFQIWVASYIFPSNTGISVYFRDITEKKKMQIEMLQINKQLRELTAHQEKIREEERKKLAGELHDEFGQLITSIKLDADWLNNKITDEQPLLKQKIKDIISLSSDTARKVRSLAQSLRPSIIDDMGIVAAIEWQFLEFKKRTGIICNFTHDVNNEVLTEEISIQLFRILQESLTNVMRHSNATEVSCNIYTNEADLIFTITDNGKGFNINENKNTFGIFGMRERVKTLGGTFTITSEIDKGTTTNFKIPLKTVL